MEKRKKDCLTNGMDAGVLPTALGRNNKGNSQQLYGSQCSREPVIASYCVGHPKMPRC